MLMGKDKKQPATSWRTEAIAGVTTFFTMAYIVVVNPAILSTEGTGMAFSGVLTATVVLCFSMTLLMGLYAKLPFAVAPGMGINAFFAYTIILGQRVPWPVALGIVFWAGVLFLIVSITPVRETIARAIPASLRIATAAGIGIFLTFIGLKNSGLIVADPVTFVKLGMLDRTVLLMILGTALTVWLLHRKSPLAYLVGNIFCHSGGVGSGTLESAREVFERAGFSERLFQARHFRRAQALAPARDYLDSLHGPVRFHLDLYRRVACGGDGGQGRLPAKSEGRIDSGLLGHARRRCGRARLRARPISKASRG